MKQIALYDVDGKIPNFALMKLSAYHKSIGDDVEMYKKRKRYDRIYASSIFTFSDKSLVTNEMIVGGSGFDLNTTLDHNVESAQPDYSLYPAHNHAIGFLTRGCSRHCKFCIVPKKEGFIRQYSTVDKILQNRKTAILLDNNVLAIKHGIEQIEKIAKLGVKVDFNQGLDARLIDNGMAKLLARVNWLAPIRLACDTISQISAVKNAVGLLRWHNATPRRYFVYVLVDNVESALVRVKFLKSMNLDPFAQPLRDNSSEEISKKAKNFARWVNHKAIFKTTTWEEYNEKKGRNENK